MRARSSDFVVRLYQRRAHSGARGGYPNAEAATALRQQGQVVASASQRYSSATR